MSKTVLILGGQGRIGQSVAVDLLCHTEARLTLTGRSRKSLDIQSDRVQSLILSLGDKAAVAQAIQSHDVVIHCAGPFRDRNHHVLQTCIESGVPYLDVADSPDYVKQALTYGPWARQQRVTAIVGAGVFPGISNSMARQCIEQVDQAEALHLSYLVAGSGGAGVTVMRTTFLELQTPFVARQEGHEQLIQPYSEREVLNFSKFGPGGVYWFNTVEALTLPRSFPALKTVTTKFGSVPDLYNHLTWMVSKAPRPWLQHPILIESLAQVSYRMTQISDRFSGVGIAMRIEVQGITDDRRSRLISTFYHPDTATAAGQGVGAIAQAILINDLAKPGVWSVEQCVPTPVFKMSIAPRGLQILEATDGLIT